MKKSFLTLLLFFSTNLLLSPALCPNAWAQEALQVYCGAGLAKPFQHITKAFHVKTGQRIEASYSNAGQSQSQIRLAQEGDIFVAGSVEELKPIQQFVQAQKNIVRHIPVLAVAKGNPHNVQSMNDLKGLRLVLGDGKATPIGKVGDAALRKSKIQKDVNIVSRATTAPAVAMALKVAECDAIIVWKENVMQDSMDIIDVPELTSMIKTVPAASLTFSKNTALRQEFLQFLDTDTVKNIWKQFGYEVIEQN